MTVHIEECDRPDRTVYGIFRIDGVEIGRADKTPDGWWIPQHTKTPVSPEDAPRVILETAIAKSKARIKEATRMLAVIGAVKPKVTKNETTLRAFLAQCREKKIEAIPDTDPVFDYAESILLPGNFLALAWAEFVDRYKDTDKKQKSWPQTFRVYIRNGFLKLWFKSDTGWQLTTAGMQAQARFNGRKPKANGNGAHA